MGAGRPEGRLPGAQRGRFSGVAQLLGPSGAPPASRARHSAPTRVRGMVPASPNSGCAVGPGPAQRTLSGEVPSAGGDAPTECSRPFPQPVADRLPEPREEPQDLLYRGWGGSANPRFFPFPHGAWGGSAISSPGARVPRAAPQCGAGSAGTPGSRLRWPLGDPPADPRPAGPPSPGFPRSGGCLCLPGARGPAGRLCPAPRSWGRRRPRRLGGCRTGTGARGARRTRESKNGSPRTGKEQRRRSRSRGWEEGG